MSKIVDSYCYKQIKENFLNENFSHLTMSFVKEVLFDIYMQSAKNELTNFKISQELGITPTQVKSLRFKYEQNKFRSSAQAGLTIESVLVESPALMAASPTEVKVFVSNRYKAEWLYDQLSNDKDVFLEITLSRDVIRMPTWYYFSKIEPLIEENEEIDTKISRILSASQISMGQKKGLFKTLTGKKTFQEFIDTAGSAVEAGKLISELISFCSSF